MFVKFNSLQYIPGEYSVRQKVKGGRTPHNAVHGGCGSFVVRDESPQLILILGTKKHSYKYNIYSLIKSISNKRLTAKYRNTLANLFEESIFEIKNNQIQDLESTIKELVINEDTLDRNSKK